MNATWRGEIAGVTPRRRRRRGPTGPLGDLGLYLESAMDKAKNNSYVTYAPSSSRPSQTVATKNLLPGRGMRKTKRGRNAARRCRTNVEIRDARQTKGQKNSSECLREGSQGRSEGTPREARTPRETNFSLTSASSSTSDSWRRRRRRSSTATVSCG